MSPLNFRIPLIRPRRRLAALTPAGGATAAWLDQQILSGRFAVGASPEEQALVQARILLERFSRSEGF